MKIEVIRVDVHIIVFTVVWLFGVVGVNGEVIFIVWNVGLSCIRIVGGVGCVFVKVYGIIKFVVVNF